MLKKLMRSYKKCMTEYVEATFPQRLPLIKLLKLDSTSLPFSKTKRFHQEMLSLSKILRSNEERYHTLVANFRWCAIHAIGIGCYWTSRPKVKSRAFIYFNYYWIFHKVARRKGSEKRRHRWINLLCWRKHFVTVWSPRKIHNRQWYNFHRIEFQRFQNYKWKTTLHVEES